MVVLKALPSMDIISGFKGVVDFYVHCGVPCARMWPRSPGKKRSPAVEAQWPTFAYASSTWNTLSPAVQQSYRAMTAHSGLNGRDIYSKGYIGGIYRYPHLGVPELKFFWLGETPEILELLNASPIINWTTLDLAPWLPSDAFAIIFATVIHVDNIGAGMDDRIDFVILPDGLVPTAAPISYLDGTGCAAGSDLKWQSMVGLANGLKVHYYLGGGGTIQVDIHVYLMGYFTQ